MREARMRKDTDALRVCFLVFFFYLLYVRIILRGCLIELGAYKLYVKRERGIVCIEQLPGIIQNG